MIGCATESHKLVFLREREKPLLEASGSIVLMCLGLPSFPWQAVLLSKCLCPREQKLIPITGNNSEVECSHVFVGISPRVCESGFATWFMWRINSWGESPEGLWDFPTVPCSVAWAGPMNRWFGFTPGAAISGWLQSPELGTHREFQTQSSCKHTLLGTRNQSRGEPLNWSPCWNLCQSLVLLFWSLTFWSLTLELHVLASF